MLELPAELKRYEIAPGICEIRYSKGKAIFNFTTFIAVVGLFAGLYFGDHYFHFSFISNHSKTPYIINGLLLITQLEFFFKSIRIFKDADKVVLRLTPEKITDLAGSVPRTIWWQKVSSVGDGIFGRGKITLEFETAFGAKPGQQSKKWPFRISYMFLAISRANLARLISAYANAYSPLMHDKA